MTETNGFDVPPGDEGSSNAGGGHTPGFTGRYLVSFEPGSSSQAAAILQNQAGVRAASSQDTAATASNVDNLMLEEIGIAIVSVDPDQHKALEAAIASTSTPVQTLEPERVVWAAIIDPVTAPGVNGRARVNHGERWSIASPTYDEEAPPVQPADSRAISAEFLRGYAAAVKNLLDTYEGNALLEEPTSLPEPSAADTSTATWGLLATRALEVPFSGRGIRVAVLDTGFDRHHPDFAGRTVVSRSFVDGESAQDGHGHGTHCIGTACGPRSPSSGRRYGVAYEAEIYAGKVLSNAGSGSDGSILAGINWAVQNRCAVVSMSLGAPVAPGQTFSQTYQNAARTADQKGTLIVAAAGNDSVRPGSIRPVSHPANCPTIVAIGALDSALRVGSFSNGGINPNGGEVNVTGPGVSVYSAWPMPTRYRTIGGTSMATPHVAGIAALYAQATGLRGLALGNHLLRRSRRLSPVRDFGWGLVQAM